MKNKNYIRHAPYLRNSVAYDHNFWYTCVIWWYLLTFYSYFTDFDFLGCSWGKKPKMAQNNKTVLSVTFRISGTIRHMISPGGFFSFFQDFDFLSVRVVIGKKIVQNDKKICLSCSISQEAYITWSWFLVHTCKMMTFPEFFIIGLLGDKTAKNDSKCRNILPV